MAGLFDAIVGLFGRERPKTYGENELAVVAAHIERHFGSFSNVLYEIVSPDIRVDICVVKPGADRDFYTLVTMGMGAHRMRGPKVLGKDRNDRIELLITLPGDWNIHSDDERWYWPIRALKLLARLPIRNKTWLGWGHTVASDGSFAENTELCGAMLVWPNDEDASFCPLPSGERVIFFQLLPLYASEMEFKLENDAMALWKRFGEDFDMTVDIRRSNVCKTG